MKRRALLAIALVGAPASAQAPGWSVQDDPQGTLDEARAEERGILDEVAQVDRELLAVRAELDSLQQRAAEIEVARTRHADEQASAEAVLERHREGMSERLAALYRQQRTGLARVVFGAEDPTELRRRSAYFVALAGADLGRFQEYAAALDARRAAVQDVDKDLQALAAVRAELQLKEAELRDTRSRKLEILGEVQARRETALRALSEMSGARTDLGTRLAGAGGVVRDGSTQGDFRAAFGRLPWPTTGRLVRGFGSYTDERTGSAAESKGIDVAADYGTPVRAVFEGVVTLADYVRGYGQTVAVEHGPYTTIYAHLGGLRVRKGQQVRAGDVLGLVGNTGLTDGAGYLLTFELRYNRTAQDPLAWLAPR